MRWKERTLKTMPCNTAESVTFLVKNSLQRLSLLVQSDSKTHVNFCSFLSDLQLINLPFVIRAEVWQLTTKGREKQKLMFCGWVHACTWLCFFHNNLRNVLKVDIGRKERQERRYTEQGLVHEDNQQPYFPRYCYWLCIYKRIHSNWHEIFINCRNVPIECPCLSPIFSLQAYYRPSTNRSIAFTMRHEIPLLEW